MKIEDLKVGRYYIIKMQPLRDEYGFMKLLNI